MGKAWRANESAININILHCLTTRNLLTIHLIFVMFI